MKNFIFLPVISFLFCSVIVYSQGLNFVHSPDGNNVFAVGNEGSVYHSSDGGATFNAISLGLNKLYSVYSLNQKIWVAGENGVNVSTDGGATFNFVPVTGMTLKSIFFADGNTGWVAGNSGFIGVSTDGGMSWNAQSSPVSSDLNAIKFSGIMNGIACGNNGVILNTSNGGASWNNIVNVFGDNDLLSLDFKNLFAVATSSNGFILKSTNSGNSWSFIDYQIVTRSQVRGVSISGQNTFYSCGGGGFIRKSTDGGASFSFQQNPMMANLSSIFFYDSLRGWAVNQNNDAIMSTSDGGANWSLPTGTTVTMSWQQTLSSSGNIGNSLTLHPQNKKGMFVICGSTVYRSLDLGNSWAQVGTAISFSGEAHSLFIYPKDTNQFIASIGSSGDGRVVKSTDYGTTWTSVWGPGNLTDYGVPLAVDPNHPNIVFIAPDASPVLRSTDFGNSWNNWSTMSFNNPCDIVVTYDNSNIMYFGDQGGARVYKSTDSGVNWTLLISPSGAEIPMIGISNLNLNNIYFTNWSGSGFWKSTDGGLNFSVAENDGDAWGTDVAKDDPNSVAFATWGDGMSFISTNGGKDFVNLPVSDVNYGVYFYDKANLIIQEGSGIYKLNVTYSLLVPAKKNSGAIPKEFSLYQNYPNPFNPVTKIQFDLPVNSFVTLTVYDILGKETGRLINGTSYNAGRYSVDFNGSNLSSGIYFYRVEAKETMGGSTTFTHVNKMVLIK